MTTAYERIGGEPAVRRVIRALYDRLLLDPIVGFLFAGRDLDHIVSEQVAFTCAFLGGPQRYTGKALPEAHAELPLLAGHFDRRHHLLGQVLAEQAVPNEVQELWLRVDSALRTSVLSAGEAARVRTAAPH
ncbi:MAG: group 1 truncated hemoglobin [Myxococcales bacterium]|nr:group 1 truncated hemoglobin [Myxococcales bacterium]